MQLAASRIIAACRIIAMNIQVQVAISFRWQFIAASRIIA